MQNLEDEHIYIGYFTASIYKWKSLLKPDKYKQLVVNSLEFLVHKNRATIYAFVIMPNHIHLLWKIAPKHALKNVQRDFLKFIGQAIKFDLIKNHPKVLENFRVDLRDRTFQFWQRNSLNKLLDSRNIIEQKLDYIHNNPVQGKWMLADSPLDYNFSSAKFYEENDTEFNFLTHYMAHFEE